ncbi:MULTISPECIES: TMEM175 family protein [Acinetobacter]|uniref:TMEM175 family protein n=1 Tax=Acinetobacter geminorum TaxID=2730922 RepID=A0ABT8ZBP7_9GAMM|nr:MULTISPECIES: TMEM175 family protein [Acinetobacter]MCU4361570.1 DUF1211 domain-containing protein [Acinetobacter sp. WU_MDCI_Abxc22]MDO7362144.1 TMEM175 family protein [Acinetobacter geminorum]OTL16303.1 hypothetical protein B9X79_16905 [Acinetobacter pittii]
MNKKRLELLSDVFFVAVILSMVMHIEIPKNNDFYSLVNEACCFTFYVLTFIFIVILWNCHYHLFQVVDNINGKIFKINLFFIFWITIIPFSVEWMVSTNFSRNPVSIYTFILFVCSICYKVLEKTIIRFERKKYLTSILFNNHEKLFDSNFFYFFSFVLSWFFPKISLLFLSFIIIFLLFSCSRVEKYFNECKSH